MDNMMNVEDVKTEINVFNDRLKRIETALLFEMPTLKSNVQLFSRDHKIFCDLLFSMEEKVAGLGQVCALLQKQITELKGNKMKKKAVVKKKKVVKKRVVKKKTVAKKRVVKKAVKRTVKKVIKKKR